MPSPVVPTHQKPPSPLALGILCLCLAGALIPGNATAQTRSTDTGAGSGPGSRWQRAPLEVRRDADIPDDFLIGLEASQAIAGHFGLIETDSLIQRLDDIGYRVALNAGRPDILFTFQILDMDEPNAMALPGGWIFVTRGILNIGLTDGELANLLGHEISHVLHRDFSRQGRLDGLLSLLQTAVVVAVAMAGNSASPATQGPVIAQPGTWDYPQSSGEAALAGTEVFGSVFHELLLRGYSRKLEMEADEGGRRLASLAGYPHESGASLMQKLHDRIYEDREFGYWQTHPYFTDRVAAADAVLPGTDFSPSIEEVAAYRLRIQQGLASAAATFREEALADYLYELALRTGTSAGSNVAIHAKLLHFRLDRMDKRDPLLRSYGPLEQDYDELLQNACLSRVAADQIGEIQTMRDSVDAMRRSLLPAYRKALVGKGASTIVLEHYLKNFPDQIDANEIRLKLARSYRFSGRSNLAVEKLGLVLASSPEPNGRMGEDSTDVDRARVELMRALPLISDPDVGEKLYRQMEDLELLKAVSDRMIDLADTLSALDKVGRFVQASPTSPFAQRFRRRLATLAEIEYKRGRLGEALGDQQSALTTYNRIVILAPDAPVTEEARRGITRIQALAASGSAR